MLVSNKHFIPVIGLDIHIVILFGFPIPLPHPYIGFVLDPMDYIPFIGATTKVNHVPRGVSDTSGIIIILFHIPMGGPWLLAPLIGHDSVNFFGSKKVMVEGRMLSPSGHMLMTCNDIGLPLSLKPGKKLKPLPSMYLPTSFSIPLSFGKPVMVGGPFVPDWAGVLMNLVASFGFGALMKGLGKVGRKGLKKFNHALQGKIGSNKLSKLLCKKGFEPVDLVQGIVIYDGIDFELPGPIPLTWERSWNSDSSFEGLLGHGTHLCYDMRLQEFMEEGATVVLLGDGRSALFNYLPSSGDSEYNRHEKLKLIRTDIDEYQLYHHEEKRFYTFHKTHPSEQQYRLFAIHDKSGFIITLHYNSKGHLLRVTDSVGRHLHIENDKAGRITSVTARHRGQEQVMVRYAYNEAGDLTTITDALDQSNHIEFHQHLMVSKQDRNGQLFYWEYDAKKRCVHTWGDGGLLEGFIEYYPREGYNLVTNSLGQTTTYYYTPDFVVHQVKDPLLNSQFFEYTEDFEIYRVIDEEGHMTGYNYNESGFRTSIVKPDGSEFSFIYDEAGNLLLASDAQGNSRTYIYYKENDQLKTFTDEDGNIQIYRYNKDGLLSKIEFAGESATLFEYDEDFNLAAIILSDGGCASWQYNVWGKCINTFNPLRQQQTFNYDRLGRVTEILLPDGNHVKFEYNAYYEILKAVDKHHEVRFSYTPLGSLKTREENGSKIHFIYNTEEQLNVLVNENGESYEFKRNQRGEIIQETGFDGITIDYQRDTSGKLIKLERPGGKNTIYEYDYNGQLTRCEHNDGSWETFSYDRNGQLIEAINEYTTVKFIRNNTGRIIEELQNGHRVSTVYDVNGRTKSINSSLGADITLQRNECGDIIGMRAQAAGLDNPWTTQVFRNLLGLEIERTLPGGLKSNRTYDHAGFPTSHSVTTGNNTTLNRHYRWDVNQQLKQMVDVLKNRTIKYGHDELGNLVWAQYEDGQYDYRLPDKTGNLFRTNSRKDCTYSKGGQLTTTPDIKFEYDEEGNLIKKVTADYRIWEYEWYANGMLKTVIRPDKRTVQFEYDALGRRTAKIYQQKITRWLWDKNTLLHEWIYESDKRPVTTIDENGNIHTPLEPVPGQELTTWIFDADSFSPAAKIVNGQHYSIISDYLGTPSQAYDAHGNKTWEIELDIYGKIRKLEGDKTFIPFRYQGQYEDVETGLYYNRFRYYSPDEGRYISKDPAGLKGGIHLYSYVFDPNALLDVFGLNPTYYPLDHLNRATGGFAEVTPSSLGSGTGATVDPVGFVSGNHPTHHQRSHLIAANHGGDGGVRENLVTLTSGSNHPGMRRVEDIITAHVRDGNTVLVEVKPKYTGNNLLPDSVHIYAIDQNANVIADDTIQNGLYQHHRACGCR